MKKGLGKGLGALICETNIKNENNDENEINILEIDINKIQINKTQPRKNFNEETILELANSIKTVGLINPIILKSKGDFFEIVSGERRFRAFKLLKIKKIPAIIKDYSDIKKLQVSLIENIQRENLNPIEEAITYKKLQDEFFLNQEEIAEKVGKKRTTISNAIRLLKLDERVQQFLIENKISQGHSKVILGIDKKEIQFEIATKIIEQQLNVRQTEELVKNYLENKSKQSKKEKVVDEQRRIILDTMCKQLNEIFGTKVNIKDKNNKGKIEIEYYSEEELERLISLLKNL